MREVEAIRGGKWGLLRGVEEGDSVGFQGVRERG